MNHGGSEKSEARSSIAGATGRGGALRDSALLSKVRAWSVRAKNTLFTGSADTFAKFLLEGKTTQREGTMHRGVMDTSFVEWSPEYLLLTDEHLFIAHSPKAIANAFSIGADSETHGPVFDAILLRDVIECELKIDQEDPPGGLLATPSFLSRSVSLCVSCSLRLSLSVCRSCACARALSVSIDRFLSPTLSFSPSLTLSFSLSFSLSLALELPLSLSPSLSLSRSLLLSFSRSLSLSLSLSLLHARSLACAHSFYLACAFTQTHSVALSRSIFFYLCPSLSHAWALPPFVFLLFSNSLALTLSRVCALACFLFLARHDASHFPHGRGGAQLRAQLRECICCALLCCPLRLLRVLSH